MPITINGVQCTVATGDDGQSYGIEESWPEEGPVCTIYWKCEWSKRYQLMQGLRGGRFGSLVLLPHAYPYSSNLVCHAIGQVTPIKLRTDADGYPQYAQAIVPAVYRVPTWNQREADPSAEYSDPSGKELCRTRFRVSPEVIQPPSGSFYWAAGPDSGNLIPGATIGFMKPDVEINIQRLWMPRVPLEVMRKYAGTINSNPIRIADTTFEPGRLMLFTANASATEDSMDGMTFEAEYVLMGKCPLDDEAYTPTWNEFLARDGQWYEINSEAAGTGRPPYRSTNYWELI